MTAIDALGSAIAQTQGWLHEQLVQPLLFELGLMRFAEEAFDSIEWVLIGLIEIALLALILTPLERRFPVEAVTDRRAASGGPDPPASSVEADHRPGVG